MSTPTKTNERPGVRAKLSDARFSAYKAREVLDLIRGRSVGEARSILQFCDRGAAEPVMKLLDSAVANAGNNNDIPPEELYVGACYADEGATLKRWRPRARGRATRIRKRTCHITIIVSRYSGAEMDELRARTERTGRVPSDARAERARRVARSRAAAESEETLADETAADQVVEEANADEEGPGAAPDGASEEAAADAAAAEAVESEASADTEATDEPGLDRDDELDIAEATAEAGTDDVVVEAAAAELAEEASEDTSDDIKRDQS